MKRRSFLSQTALGGAFIGTGAWVHAAGDDPYPYDTIDEAFSAVGFDPSAEGNAFFAVAADCHYGLAAAEGLLPIIEELNSLERQPDFFLVNGDLIVSASISFGTRPNEKQREAAHQEFLQCRQHLDRLDNKIPLKLTLGNHDTTPDEDDPEMFHRVFPEHAPYQSFDLAGAHFVFLNGHGDGRIDGEQADWFSEDISKIDPGQEVITFVHQPSIGAVVRERRIAPAYQQAFAEHRGNVWAVCGHVHTNRERVFELPETTLAQASITCAAKGIWGGSEKPGYWLYLLQGGKVTQRIFRQLEKGFRLQALPNRDNATVIEQPFDHVENIVWQTLISEGDRPFLVDGNEARDNISWWYSVRRLVYRLPLAEAKANRLAILASIEDRDKDGSSIALIRLSEDNETWQTMAVPEAFHSVYEFDIPESLLSADELYVEIARNEGSRNIITVAGYALLNSPPLAG